MGTKVANRHDIAVPDFQNFVRLFQIGKKSEEETYIFPAATSPYLHKKTAGCKDIPSDGSYVVIRNDKKIKNYRLY